MKSLQTVDHEHVNHVEYGIYTSRDYFWRGFIFANELYENHLREFIFKNEE